MNYGRVYWVTGLHNSGKTTIGTALYYELKKRRNNVVILDGDIMKDIASGTETAEYNLKDRLIRAKRYSKMAKMLADQGLWVVVCAIAMFDEIRDWNRNNIKGYIEIFLEVPIEILKQRGNGKLYQSEEITSYPKYPDLVVKNDGSIAVREIVKSIKSIQPQNEEDYDRDRKDRKSVV